MTKEVMYNVQIIMTGHPESLETMADRLRTEVEHITWERSLRELQIFDACHMYAFYNNILNTVYTGFDITYEELFDFGKDYVPYIDFRGDVKRSARLQTKSFDTMFNNYMKHLYELMMMSEEDRKKYEETIHTKDKLYAKQFPIDLAAGGAGFPTQLSIYRNFGMNGVTVKATERLEEWAYERCGTRYIRPLGAKFTVLEPGKHMYTYVSKGGDSLKAIKALSRFAGGIKFDCQVTREDEVTNVRFVHGQQVAALDPVK